MSKLAINGIILAVAFMTVLGNIALKISADGNNPYSSIWFFIGATIYASTAIGVVAVLRYSALINASYIYNICSLLLIVAVGVIMFDEHLSIKAVAGIIFSFIAIYLLN